MKLAPLYQISEKLIDLLEEEEYDEAAMDALLPMLEQKAGNIAHAVEWIGDMAEAIKARETKLTVRRKALENKVTWLKDYLRRNMEATGIQRIEDKTSGTVITLVKNPPHVVLVSEDDVPSEFKIEVTTLRTNKTKVMEALKRGEEVPGAHLERSWRVNIK